MNRTAQTAWKIALATLLSATSGLNFVSPVAAKTTQAAQADLPSAVETKVPALVRAQLPRRATTVFYVKARLENRDFCCTPGTPPKRKQRSIFGCGRLM